MEQQAPLELTDVLGALRRRSRLMTSVATPILVAGVVIAVALPDVYRSSAMIDIRRASVSRQLEDPRSLRDRGFADQYINSLRNTVLSDASLQGLLDEVRAYPELADTGDAAAAFERLREDVRVDMVKTLILDEASGREREIYTAFTVSGDSIDPAIAQQVATWAAHAFLDQDRAERLKRSRAATAFFSKEAQTYAERVAALEAEVADFKARNLGQLPEAAGVNLTLIDQTERELQAVQTQITGLRQNKIYLTQELTQAGGGFDTALVSQLEAEYRRQATIYDANHPDLVALRKQIEALRQAGRPAGGSPLQAELESQRQLLAQMQQRYSADHPSVRQVQRQIESLEAAIAAGGSVQASTPSTPAAVQLQSQISALDVQIAGLQARSGELRARLDDARSRARAAPEAEREYLAVTRELTLVRQKHQELLDKTLDAQVTEAAIAGGSDDEFILVQAPAIPVEPVQPRRTAIALFAALLAVFVAFSAAIVAEFADPTVRSSRDVRMTMGMTPIAAVPVIETPAVAAARRRQAKLWAGSLLAGVPILYLIVRAVA